MTIQKQILNQSKSAPHDYTFKDILFKRSYYKRSAKEAASLKEPNNCIHALCDRNV